VVRAVGDGRCGWAVCAERGTTRNATRQLPRGEAQHLTAAAEGRRGLLRQRISTSRFCFGALGVSSERTMRAPRPSATSRAGSRCKPSPRARTKQRARTHTAAHARCSAHHHERRTPSTRRRSHHNVAPPPVHDPAHDTTNALAAITIITFHHCLNTSSTQQEARQQHSVAVSSIYPTKVHGRRALNVVL
jgi:hypothetical protein